MKGFLKENYIRILFLVFLGLLFILWGRVLLAEMQLSTSTKNLGTTEARLSCLSHYGWEAEPISEIKKTIFIPDPLDETFKTYNRLQTVCGFDLERYCGKKVICYTYEVLNFPYETEEPVYVNLLVFEGALIGGDCTSEAADGFTLPLDRKYLP